MKPEKQRIAIAEACGWSQIEYRSERLMMAPGFSVVGYPPKKALIGKKEPIPDFLNDLNATREAAMHLTPAERRKFDMWLTTIAIREKRHYCELEAKHWSEAFLRTIGRWEDK